MSSQGTGSTDQLGHYRQLLDCWGSWSRSGDLGLGFNPPGIVPKAGGVGLMFSYDEIDEAEAAILTLGQHYQRIIKKVYLHRDLDKIRGEDITAAVTAFADSMDGWKNGVDSLPK